MKNETFTLQELEAALPELRAAADEARELAGELVCTETKVVHRVNGIIGVYNYAVRCLMARKPGFEAELLPKLPLPIIGRHVR